MSETPPEPPVICPAKKYLYDTKKFVWKEIDAMIRIVKPNTTVGKGGMRVCYEVEDIDEHGRATSNVAKVFRTNITDVVEKDYFNEGQTQCMCEMFAHSFNRKHALTGTTLITFLQRYVVRIPRRYIPEEHQHKRTGFFSYKTQDTREVMFVMEPKLKGEFTKYNSNFGEIYSRDKRAKFSPEGEKRRTEILNAAEAFSHFTLVESGGSMLVCDLQGVQDFLTDPQIHTEDGKGLGMGNMGQDGIDKWAQKHVCNRVCQSLRMHPLNGIAPMPTKDSMNNRYAHLRAQLRRQKAVTPQELIPLQKPLDQMSEEERVEYVLRLSELLDK